MKILCVIVLYNQNLYISLSYTSFVKEAIMDDNIFLFIYDNSPLPQHSQNEFLGNNVKYVSDPQNSGISVAYNTAADFARLNGYSWLLLLDQDTTITDCNYLNLFYCKCKEYPNINLFAPQVITKQGRIMSPLRLCYRIPIISKLKSNTMYKTDHIGIINSGMFIKTDAFFRTGGYKNDVFLDYADYQFIERFSKVYKHFYVLDSVLIQDFSNSEKDLNKLINRYIMFCKSLVGFEKNSVWDSINIFAIVLKRAISLSLRTKNITFIRLFFRYYL